MCCLGERIAQAYDVLPECAEVSIINTQTKEFNERCDDIIRHMAFQDDRRAYSVKLTIVVGDGKTNSHPSFAKAYYFGEQSFSLMKSKILESCKDENFEFATAIVKHEEYARCKGVALSRKVYKYYIFI